MTKRVYAESKECCAFISWCDLHPTIGHYIFHIKNENDSKKTVWQLKRLTREGIRKGIPDYFYAYPFGGRAGLFIEMKAKNGIVTKAQKEMLERFSMVGYECVVSYGWEEAVEAVKKYRFDLIWRN